MERRTTTNPLQRNRRNLQDRRMRLPALLLVSLSVAAFPSALSASLNSAEEDGGVAQQDDLTELQKIDEMKFEAAQRHDAAQRNVSEEQKDDGGSRDEQTEAEGVDKGQRSGNSDAPEDSESSEESEGRQRRDEMTADSTKDRDDQCSTTGPSVRGGDGHGDTGAQGEQQ